MLKYNHSWADIETYASKPNFPDITLFFVKFIVTLRFFIPPCCCFLPKKRFERGPFFTSSQQWIKCSYQSSKIKLLYVNLKKRMVKFNKLTLFYCKIISFADIAIFLNCYQRISMIRINVTFSKKWRKWHTITALCYCLVTV